MAQPRGFCAGVERAIEIVERALKKFGPPIYVRHEIVHNRHVVEDLRKRGAVFVDEIDEVPPGAMTIFSAHGVARRVEELAAERGLPTIDATCPLVAKVHAEGRRYAAGGREIVLVGHAGHAEVEGTIGQIPGRVHLVQTVDDVATLEVANPSQLAYITQTTLSVDDTRVIIAALQARFPRDQGPGRARHLLRHAKPAERGARPGRAGRHDPGRRQPQQLELQPPARDRRGARASPSYLIDDASPAGANGSRGVESVGVTAGASAPETLVQGVLQGLRRFDDDRHLVPWRAWRRTCGSVFRQNCPTSHSLTEA